MTFQNGRHSVRRKQVNFACLLTFPHGCGLISVEKLRLLKKAGLLRSTGNKSMNQPMNQLASQEFEVEVFFDGGCPLCRREINMLKRWDRRRMIRFTDLQTPALQNGAAGKSFDELMDRIHGRLPDGSLIEGVEVFRRMYAAVGMGWIVAVTRIPGISHLMNFGYRVFARNRLRLTGRCSNGACAMPHKGSEL